MLNGDKQRSFPLKSELRQRRPSHQFILVCIVTTNRENQTKGKKAFKLKRIGKIEGIGKWHGIIC